MNEIQVNKGYELYQIITDFGDPLEIFREAFQNAIDENADEVFCRVYEKKKLGGSDLIIDIWNNGEGLTRNKVAYFFDLANSLQKLTITEFLNQENLYIRVMDQKYSLILKWYKFVQELMTTTGRLRSQNLLVK